MIEAKRGKRPNDQLLEDPDAFRPVAGNDVDGQLDMQVLRRERIDIGEIDILPLDLQFSVIEAVSPFWMGVAKAAHLKAP